MAGWRQAVELAMSREELAILTTVSRSRTELASRVSRAQMLLAYHDHRSFCAVGKKLGVHHQTVQRCAERALAYGPLAALDDRPRPGKEPTITPEAKAWLVSVACDKAKDHGYPHELWTTRLLARHARERGPAAGHRFTQPVPQSNWSSTIIPRTYREKPELGWLLDQLDASSSPSSPSTARGSTSLRASSPSSPARCYATSG